MGLIEFDKRKRRSVEKWSRDNLHVILEELERDRKYWFDLASRRNESTIWYERELRWLSEMPLCNSLHKITPPEGFKVKYGKVTLVGAEEIDSPPHYFYYDQDFSDIICLTAGQFVLDNSISFARGERIRSLVARAPELIRIYNDDIAVLHATRGEIRNKMGLIYSPYDSGRW